MRMAHQILVTDTGRSFVLEEFKQFAIEWCFLHKMSCPRYPQGNAHAERAAGIVKEVYTKCKDDFLLGLLVHYTTPLLYMRSKRSPTSCHCTNHPSFSYIIHKTLYRLTKQVFGKREMLYDCIE